MVRVHRIHEQRVELRARDEGLAHDLLERVSALHRRELVAILDRVCTDASPHSGPTHRLERLELELGSIDPENFELEFRRAFEAALRRALDQAIADAGTGAEGLADDRPPGDLLELVEVFATTGALPWWADGRRGDLIRRSVGALIQTAPTPLRRLIVRLGDRPQTLARVVVALDEPTRVALLERVLPGAGERLARELSSARADALARCELWTAALVSAALAVDCGGSSVDERFAIELLERAPTRTGAWTRAELARVLELELPRVHADPSTPTRADESEQARAAKPSKPETPLTRELELHDQITRATAEPASTRDLPEPGSTPESEDVARATANARPAKVRPEPRVLASQPRAPTTPRRAPTPPRRPRPPALHPSLDAIPIDDAGLVLLWPFIPHLLRHCELMVDDAFVDARAQAQAVALLEHCARGRVELVEYQLVLDKILCGLAPDDVLAPLDPEQPVAPALLTEADRMLEAVIAHAEILRDMSIDTLRAAFLRREGLLKIRDGSWLLQVESQTHDIVLERFPWSFAWVKLPWMPDPMQVEWA